MREINLDFDAEQKEIFRVCDRLDKIHGREWGKYKGDVVVRTVIELLKQHLHDSYDIVGPNVYISERPTEFDAMVVKKDSRPIPRSAAYENDCVKLIIEIKKQVSTTRRSMESQRSESTSSSFGKLIGHSYT
jgi:hypothetical protein